MFLSRYYSERQGVVAVSGRQASRFAKSIAGDFNPIHDEDARKFCVPGDLIFALVVERLGVFGHMNFQFLGTVGADMGLILPPAPEPDFAIVNERGKPVVNVQLEGRRDDDPVLSENLVREYVAFSGQNFPHILVPLMAEKGVMINPGRPLVMYESMSLRFQRLDEKRIRLALSETSLDVEGKRGRVKLHFELFSGDTPVGYGTKHLALGGLQPFDQGVMDRVIEEYEAKKANYGLTSEV